MVKYAIILLIVSLLIYETVDGACRPTSQDILGPYYVRDSKHYRKFCTSEAMFDRGDRLVVRGRVIDEDCRPVRRTRIDVWQADPSGRYYLGDCRGYINTDARGYYRFTTIHPGKYAIDRQRYRFRPAHLHLKIFGGFRLNDLVTQMYFAGDSNLGRNDSCGVCNSNRPDLVVRPRVYCDNPERPGCVEVAVFNIILSKKRFKFRRIFERIATLDKVLNSLSNSRPSEKRILEHRINRKPRLNTETHQTHIEQEKIKPSTVTEKMNGRKFAKKHKFPGKVTEVSDTTNISEKATKRTDSIRNIPQRKKSDNKALSHSKLTTSDNKLSTVSETTLAPTSDTTLPPSSDNALIFTDDNTSTSDSTLRSTSGNALTSTSENHTSISGNNVLTDSNKLITPSDSIRTSTSDNMLTPASENKLKPTLHNNSQTSTSKAKKNSKRIFVDKSVQNSLQTSTKSQHFEDKGMKSIKKNNNKDSNIVSLDDILNFIFNKHRSRN